MALKEQMELFDDGGLMEEGGTTDPVSGNDVPVGSTQEEVRDDIPAQLSEGEFVFPADVVRYIGLEKLMQMRQEAKMGLSTMDKMGQMGNGDEAVMPDDIPFELSDLDMEDDMEYNVGGYVPPQQSFVPTFNAGVGFVPSAVTTPQPATVAQPIAPPVEYVRPQQTVTPTQPDYSNLTFQEAMTAPQAPRLEEIINPETGERRTINYIPGVTQLPDGFVLASEYTAPDAQATSVTPVVGQAQVRKDDDDRSADESRRKANEANARKTMIDELFGKDYSATNFAPTFADLTGGLKPGMVSTGGYLIGDNGEYLDPSTGMQKFFGLDSARYAINPSSAPPLKLKPGGVNEKFIKTSIEKSIKDDSPRRKGDTVSTETGSVSADMILDSIRKKQDSTPTPTKKTFGSDRPTPVSKPASTKPDKDKRKPKVTFTQTKKAASKPKTKDTIENRTRGKPSEAKKDKPTRFGGRFEEGGLASKPKPKPKQMRSGGLASKN